MKNLPRPCLVLALLSFFAHAHAEDAPKPTAPVPTPEVKPAPAIPAVPLKERLEKLQGVWEGVETDGGKCVVTINGDTLHIHREHGNAWHLALLDTPEGAGAQELRATIKESSKPEYVGKAAGLLYRLEADGSLSLAGGPPGEKIVPKGFEKDPRSRIFSLKKVPAKPPTTPATPPS